MPAAMPQRASAESDANSRTFLQKHGQKLVALAIWAVIIVGYTVYAQLNDLSFVELFESTTEFLFGPLGPVLYIILYALRPILFFPASVLTVAGGAIFGPIGILYVVIGANTSAMVAYSIGRFFGDGLLTEGESQTIIQRYADRMRANSFETILIMRFIFLPYDLVNYLGGFLRINWKAFLLATILGSIPGTIAYTLFGATVSLEEVLSGNLPEFNPVVFGISIFMFVASLALSRIYRRREARRAEQASAE